MNVRTIRARRGFDGRSRAASRAGRALLAVAVTALGVLAATAAPAQKNPAQNQAPPNAPNQGPPNALQGFSQNSGEPVKIQSDKLDVHPKENVATFSGNVVVIQGDTELRSKVLVVYYVDTSKPSTAVPATTMKTAAPGAPPGSSEQQQIRKIEASGGVLVTQKDQNAAGDTGVFDLQSNTVTLNGNVVVTQGKNVVRGQRMVVNLTTGVSHITPIEGGRVDALFGAAPNGEMSLPVAPPRASPTN